MDEVRSEEESWEAQQRYAVTLEGLLKQALNLHQRAALEAAQAELQRERVARQAMVAVLQTTDEVAGLLTQSLVNGDIVIGELRTHAEGQREQLEGDKKRVKGK